VCTDADKRKELSVSTSPITEEQGDKIISLLEEILWQLKNSSIESDVSSIESHVASIQSDVSSIQADVSSIEANQ